VIAKTLLEAKNAENAQTTQYTTPVNTRTIIDKMTATNTTAGAVVLTTNLVASGGAAAATNVVMSTQSIAAGATYACPEVAGHILNPGDFISTLAGAAASIVIRISGREVS
jgi:hypothetical protein